MRHDLEETLTQELRTVAGDLDVPAMPRLHEEPQGERPRAGRRPMLLAAAAVALVVVGLGGVLATVLDGDKPDPAQPSPAPSLTPSPSSSPSTEEPSRPIPTTAPTVPHILDSGLYVDGDPVPGEWWMVRSAGASWIALDQDYSWWWGRGPTPRELPGGEDVTPAISPDGRYVALVRAEDGASVLTVLDTETGEKVGGTPVALGRQTPDNAGYVLAVLADGRVVVRRGATDVLWIPGSGNATVELSEPDPGEKVTTVTPAGLVVADGDGGQAYLATLSDEGELTRVRELPEHDDLIVSPGGRWMAWTPLATTGGDVTAVSSLEVQPLDGGEQMTVTAPDGWAFQVRTWVWEDDDHLVATVSSDKDEQMVRCSPQQRRCVLLDAPGG